MSTELRDITDLADIQKVESPPHDIRFIDSHYKELFRIPDGGTILVEYPNVPKRRYLAQCRYLDDYHTQIGNQVYHICQFAELLERGGGICRPLPESYLKNAEILLEDDYGMIDGVVNNGKKEPEKLAPKRERPSVAEQLKGLPHREPRPKTPGRHREQER